MDEESRFYKIDDAIQRLATVSADLSKMLAVHEQRLDTQEKAADTLSASLEKRRDEVDAKFKDLKDHKVSINKQNMLRDEVMQISMQITPEIQKILKTPR